MAAAAPKRRLDTLSYRATRELVGDATVHIRTFDASVRTQWNSLDAAYKEATGNDKAQPPRTIVTTALRALTGGYVHFDPYNLVLVTKDPVDDRTLRDTFTLLYHLSLGVKVDDIDLHRPPVLAQKVAESAQIERSIASCLRHNSNGQPDAPGWVYNTICWDLARRLSERPWNVDGHEINLRPDTNGGLVAWDHPWMSQAGTRYRLPRISLRLKTLPNIADPVILVSASATRIASSMAYTKKVLAEQRNAGLPLVEVELDGHGKVRRVNRLALQALGRLGVDRSVLTRIEDRIDAEVNARKEAEDGGKDMPKFSAVPPGPVRPIAGKNFTFPVGSGVGMHFYRELDQHIRTVFGQAAQTPETRLAYPSFRREEDLAPPESVHRSIRTMGFEQLRIVCLWYRDQTRLRMIKGLCDAYGLDYRTADPAEGQPLRLFGDSVTAVFHQVPAFLEHGAPGGRRDAIASGPVATSLTATADTLVAAWCETKYGEVEVLNDGKLSKPGAGDPSDADDAKPQTRVILAEKGIPSQYLAGKKEPKRAPAKETKNSGRDHQVALALADLYRSLGIIDDRVGNTLSHRPDGYDTHLMAHCGVHVRRQSKRPGERSAKICITATVLKPPVKDDEAWTLHGWSYTARSWAPYHQAQNTFHASAYPTGKLTKLVDDQEGCSEVARVIDTALAELVTYLDGIPFTVTVDGFACRRLYPGLHNNKQGATPGPNQTWLPGSSNNPEDRPAAVIRINTQDEEMPQPISTTSFTLDGDEKDKGARSTLLFQMATDFGDPTWILCNVPRQFDAGGQARLGSDKTRWSAEPSIKIAEGKWRPSEIKPPWYTMSATEIYPIAVRPGIPGQALAVAIAKLCHQTLSWTDRTRFPVQLHAAAQMDWDHPQYRRTAPPQEKEVPEPDIDKKDE